VIRENDAMKISFVFKNNVARVQAAACVLCKNGGMTITPQTSTVYEMRANRLADCPYSFSAWSIDFSLQTFSL